MQKALKAVESTEWLFGDDVKGQAIFLGLIIDSAHMRLSLPWDKRLGIKALTTKLIKTTKVSLENLARVIGTLVAACPAVAEDLLWWNKQIMLVNNRIRSCAFEMEIFSDASQTGWGATCGELKTHGLWSAMEREKHINWLEIKAASLAIRCFAISRFDAQILLRIDNVTALAYINKMGGTKHQDLHEVTKDLWLWCEEKRIWVFAEYVVSKENPADEGSRINNLDTEWELSDRAFRDICRAFEKPSIDLFASRINTKCIKNSPTGLGPFPGSRAVIRQAFERKDLDAETVEIMVASVSSNTIKQYGTALKFWWEFCAATTKDPFKANEKEILECLTRRYEEGAAYGTLTCFRAAVALISDEDWSKSQLLNRFFKGVFRTRPTAPKYAATWDVSIVLDLIETWEPLESLNLRMLTLKLTMLLALGSAFRVQALVFIKLRDIKFIGETVEITIKDVTKTSRPGSCQPYAKFHPFRNKRLCIATVLKFYIQKTEDIRADSTQLLVSFQHPHKAVGTNTVSRWLRAVMKQAGVDEQFTAHSTRHASTSKAWLQGVNIKDIKKAAGWSDRSNTFYKFYNRQISKPDGAFAMTVLSKP
ncbi:uncharacterized protein LOC106643825 [Copidosoma floridanum]|uniref:uncharacterized protein LOC106643825 n=1 Tax=Copidosoma floridanum TaxID=29053 RepID=UPI000C6FAAB6|nr:uncharacterized protein LOC106643825 [Copidosoma floridanum]